jgi:hypothetical protein
LSHGQEVRPQQFEGLFLSVPIFICPENIQIKAILRGAECLMEMSYGRQCREWIDSTPPASASEGDDLLAKLHAIRDKARELVLKEDRDARQRKAMVGIYFI